MVKVKKLVQLIMLNNAMRVELGSLVTLCNGGCAMCRRFGLERCMLNSTKPDQKLGINTMTGDCIEDVVIDAKNCVEMIDPTKTMIDVQISLTSKGQQMTIWASHMAWCELYEEHEIEYSEIKGGLLDV